MTRPRCLITSSSYGLGLSLANQFKEQYDIIKYDLTLGQDLNEASVRDSLIEDLRSCSLFFNNSQVYQVELLERAHQLQNDLCIINSSTAIDYYGWDLEATDTDPQWADYILKETQLNNRIRELHQAQHQGENLRSWIINLRLTWIDTEEHADRTVKKLDCGDVAGYVYHILGCWPRVCAQDILLTVPVLDIA
jgi:hypothetical protein